MDDIEELYAVAYRRLVVQLCALTGDLAEAEDVVQDAFVRALGRWPRVRTLDNPEAWLRRVAINLARSRWRRTRRGLALIGRERAVQLPELSPDHVALVRALQELPFAQREAIVLHDLVGLTVAEIAEQQSSPEGTVKSRLSRGRAAIAPQLREADQ